MEKANDGSKLFQHVQQQESARIPDRGQMNDLVLSFKQNARLPLCSEEKLPLPKTGDTCAREQERLVLMKKRDCPPNEDFC